MGLQLVAVGMITDQGQSHYILLQEQRNKNVLLMQYVNDQTTGRETVKFLVIVKLADGFLDLGKDDSTHGSEWA